MGDSSNSIAAVLAGTTGLALVGYGFWCFRTAKGWRAFALLTVLVLSALLVGLQAGEMAAQGEQARSKTLLGIQAKSYAAEVRALGDLGDARAKARMGLLEKRWMESNPLLAQAMPFLENSNHKLIPILPDQHQDEGELREFIQQQWTAHAPWLTDAFAGRSTSATGADSLTFAEPVKGKGILVLSFRGASFAQAQHQVKNAVLSTAALMVFLLFAVGVNGVELFSAAAALRQKSAELDAKNAVIQDQMVASVQKNQDLAEKQALLTEAFTRLQTLATTDGLTGVMNHRTLMDFLRQRMQENPGMACPCSVILLDIDNFKSINDQFGHPAGDEVLRIVAAVLRQSTPAGAEVGRYGGEEFLMVLPGASEPMAVSVAEELRSRIEAAQNPSRPVTASFGVATVFSNSKTDTALVNEADQALYYSKRTGKNKVTAYGFGLLELTDRRA